MLLKTLRDEYVDSFISGAMLEINQRNIQHEDIGYINAKGEHGPMKPRFDLNIWDSVVKNEKILDEDYRQYCGWWYCCIPMNKVKENNLPMPFFIRGDDVEYSIRNHTHFITMNGICIWHEGFDTKYSGVMELYQVHRNDLIVKAIHPEELDNVDVITRMTDLFWQEVYKFNYKGADLILDAVEDYLKGPQFIKTLNGEKCVQEKKKKDNVLQKMTPEVKAIIDSSGDVYRWEPLSKFKKKIYDYSCNGQRLPKAFCKNNIGVIPYGWGYYQNRQYLTKANYAVDLVNESYVVFERSKSKYKAIKDRYSKIIGKYNNENERVVKEYQEAYAEMTSEAFWKEYLK